MPWQIWFAVLDLSFPFNVNILDCDLDAQRKSRLLSQVSIHTSSTNATWTMDLVRREENQNA
jgi:hypothetical protein